MIETAGIQPKKYARIAGILYLFLFFAGPFSFFYVPSVLLVPGDSAATFARLVESESVLRWGMAAESLIFLTEIALSVLLYVLLRPVNATIALMAMVARLVQSTIQGANLFTSSVALLLAKGSPGVPLEQAQSLATLALDTHASGVLITQFFFGFHCLLLGYLLCRAGYFPRILGILMAVAAVGYLVDSYGNLLQPQFSDVYTMIVAIPAVLAELSLTFWLLIKGVKLEKWQEVGMSGHQGS